MGLQKVAVSGRNRRCDLAGQSLSVEVDSEFSKDSCLLFVDPDVSLSAPAAVPLH